MMVITVNAVDTIIIKECNMRLCTIVFPESSSSRTKEYTFKIPKMPHIKEGDILRNTNYQNSLMKVVKVFDYPVGVYNVYNGYLLKELLPEDTQIDRPSKINNNQTSNNMEKRNITISLEEARNWYNSKDQTLCKLALQAYTEKELNEPQSFKEVLDSFKVRNLRLVLQITRGNISSVIDPLKGINKELVLHMRLAFIAKYFNGTWKPDMNKTKYFLARTHHSYDLPNSIKLDNDYCVGTHERVMYPGIVYFQKQEDVRKAYEMLKDELK